MNNVRLIETDSFDFEFLSELAERESWRKEIHRPIYHLHKWWAKRLGSVFRGVLLGSLLPAGTKVADGFYKTHNFSTTSVFDPFMGSGTTIGEAHKLGLTALGRDINPVAAESVRVSLGPIDIDNVNREFDKLTQTVGQKILALYRSTDSGGSTCDVLYYFWVRQADCPTCLTAVDLFPSWTIARNAYPDRKPEIQVLCPNCGNIFASTNGIKDVSCKMCSHRFEPAAGNASGSKARCQHCDTNFSILSTVTKHSKPKFRLYGKLVLTKDRAKQYLKISEQDLAAFATAADLLNKNISDGSIALPESLLQDGHNTRQAISHGFTSWADFFNDRQLLGLGWLHAAIAKIEDEKIRDLFLLVFSGVLEFNNMFASYKGEGTGAVRHMFSHHILKPERTPIEANIWGTSKSSGSFSNLLRNRINRAFTYRENPTEISKENGSKGVISSSPFTGKVDVDWPRGNISLTRNIYLSCGDSSATNLRSNSIDLVVTDPPFFDNVHYSELADFFYSWQRLIPRGFIKGDESTRSECEVQDADPAGFATKLQAVLEESNRVLKTDGLLVFTYHHSRESGWHSVASAILNAGFCVTNAHPVKSEMSGATPKTQANDPIQLDIVIVCRKEGVQVEIPSFDSALAIAEQKIMRLQSSGFGLSKNDKKVVMYGQLLGCLRSVEDVAKLAELVEERMVATNLHAAPVDNPTDMTLTTLVSG